MPCAHARACPRSLSLTLSVSLCVIGGAITRGSRNTTVVNMSGLPAEHQERRVKIYMPAPRNTHFARPKAPQERKQWKLEYDRAGSKAGKWKNPLMGWTSTSDPLSNLNVSFSSKDAAIAFCQRNGLAYEVIEPKVMRRQAKSYGDNFRFWGRIVNNHVKTDPQNLHGIDKTIRDQAVLTNLDKLAPETANSSVLPARQPELAASPRGAGSAAQYGREEWGGKGVPKPPSAALGGAKKNPPTAERRTDLTPPPAFQGVLSSTD